MRLLGAMFLAGLALSLNVGEGVCQPPGDDGTTMLEEIRQVRIKQHGEEDAVRVQHFINQQAESQCTPVQLARQRLEEIDAERGETITENVNVTAGHGELNVTDNHGTINSDISVQIVKQGDSKKCL